MHSDAVYKITRLVN
uniref:Uncharacterized protein n=1 Tax=Arundo donax TaxID=35708 RepID=A0A0A9A4A9_ARUDO